LYVTALEVVPRLSHNRIIWLDRGRADFPVASGLAAKTFPLHLGSRFSNFETTIALWPGGPSAQMETLVSRGAQSFTQNDITKALKGAVKAGLNPRRTEIDKKTGNIIMTFTGAPDAGEPPTDRNEWDDV
jgi:hypothetical protein